MMVDLPLLLLLLTHKIKEKMMKSILMTLITLGLFSGCVSNVKPPVIKQKQSLPPKQELPKSVKQSYVAPPKKKIKLKKVEDTNYSDKYMYPEDTSAAKKDPKEKSVTPKTIATASTMTKEECITMIGQEKFDKYTAMFGSEAASIKRCTMLKAMSK
jgi:hypothetical protein